MGIGDWRLVLSEAEGLEIGDWVVGWLGGWGLGIRDWEIEWMGGWGLGAAKGGGAEGGVEGDVADGAGGDSGAKIVTALLGGDGFAAATSARLGTADGSRGQRLV
ncbi:MAG: hypothetical protein KDJ52_31800 [Anaerolineae bacterium]|nr:hypothetical protein [Anaerolineae bacterium]